MINSRPRCDSYCCHSELPVMFVVRQSVSDLGQLVLQLSVGVDLNREAHITSTIKEPLTLTLKMVLMYADWKVTEE